jgi:hypothetical protein
MKYKLLVNLLYLWLHTENQIEKSDNFLFSFALTSGYSNRCFISDMFCHFFQQKNWEFFLKLEWVWLLLLIFGTAFQKNICQKSEKPSNWNPPNSFYFQKMIVRFSLWQNLAIAKGWWDSKCSLFINNNSGYGIFVQAVNIYRITKPMWAKGSTLS